MNIKTKELKMGKNLGLDKAYANLGKGYLQHPVINSVKPNQTY